MSNVVVVDIGNTSTSIALARGGRITRFSYHPSVWPDRKAVRSVIKTAIGKIGIGGSVLCSVVPRWNRVWLSELNSAVGAKPLFVNCDLKLGIKISYPKPKTIGADRLANACGALIKYGAPVIVVDFGTAVTFDVVSAKDGYIGGVIAPGLPLMTDYLYEKTALLPRIGMAGHYGKIGKNTAEAMRIGAKVGYHGMVREITRYLKQGLGLQKATLCATGGYAKWALEGLDIPFVIDPHLTLFGLSRIYDLNCR